MICLNSLIWFFQLSIGSLASGWIYCAYLFVCITQPQNQGVLCESKQTSRLSTLKWKRRVSGSPSPLNGVLLPKAAAQLSACPGVSVQPSGARPCSMCPKEGQEAGASSCHRPLFPWGVQVSPDPGAAAWTQCRPQAPVMFAAVQGRKRQEPPLSPGGEAGGPRPTGACPLPALRDAASGPRRCRPG